jgi:hypothetical protein
MTIVLEALDAVDEPGDETSRHLIVVLDALLGELLRRGLAQARASRQLIVEEAGEFTGHGRPIDPGLGHGCRRRLCLGLLHRRRLRLLGPRFVAGRRRRWGCRHGLVRWLDV